MCFIRIEMDMSYSSQCEVMYIGPASFAGGETVVGLCLGENSVLRCERKLVRFISRFLIQNDDVSACQGIKLDEKRSTSDCDGMRPALILTSWCMVYMVTWYGIHGYMVTSFIVHLDLQ